MNLKNKRVMVIGGAGFIGSHTVDELIKRKAKVVIVDNLSTGRKENINSLAKFYKLNIANDKIKDIIIKEKPEVMYIFSFFVLVPRSTKDPLLDIDNIVGAIKILQTAKDIGVKKIIYSSSGFLYGNNPNMPVKETEPIDPVTPYVVSKSAIENYLRFYKKAYNLPFVILRYSAVYGPRQVTGAMADYIRKLYNNKQADIWGDGRKTRDYVFIKDIVRANIMALDVANNHENPVFNLGGGVETTLNKLYQTIASLLKKESKPIYHSDRPGEQIRYCLDNEKINKYLGWDVSCPLAKGLKETVEYWKNTWSKKK
ncbi:MAG: hypothetical protein A2231_02370 [Candidatus Firestonebacteria bacterium RIFOXYA2_FULL_40_8]|nr:MAG: hypothetical protein A2231_02370 [Candidatus Firestonebacteria bacterium RIFOXYA2_FULL_40_8]